MSSNKHLWGKGSKYPSERMFGYYLDESDPDILILRRPDDSIVAYFCATGATREGILKAVKDDCQQRSA